jgi:hypothetical protein
MTAHQGTQSRGTVPDGVGRDSKSVGGRESNRRSDYPSYDFSTTKSAGRVVVVRYHEGIVTAAAFDLQARRFRFDTTGH